jgi:hypothetical protein
MFDDLDETIRQLLLAELPVKNNEIDISFDQPKREWSARIARPTVNLFLYDVRDNPQLRAHQWESAPPNGRGDGLARMKRTPYRLDCFYMLTTWASEPEDEHRLLARCLLALFRHPVLPVDRLVGTLKSQPYEIQVRLASHDRLTNPAEVWSALDNEMRPSISYLVTLALDPWTEVAVPLVHTRVLRAGQSIDPHHQQTLLSGGQLAESVAIGGTVWDRFPGGSRQSGIQVAVKGSGLFATTDDLGRYLLENVPTGELTLVAWPAEGRPLEKRVQVPGPAVDYDLVFSAQPAKKKT